MIQGSAQAQARSQTASHSHTTTPTDLELSSLAPSSAASIADQDAAFPTAYEAQITQGGPLHDHEQHHSHPSAAEPVTQPSTQEPHGVLSRIWDAVMSRNPLLIRSSPALGTGSYGAVPVMNSRSEDETSSDEENNAKPRRGASGKSRGKRRQSAHGTSDNHGHFSDPRRHHRSTEWLRKRSSSITSEVGMGSDAKASFAVNPAIAEHKAESSNASTRTGSGSDAEHEYIPTAEDPPDNSPYPEVRASVPATDNTSLSINTPRMWTLSLIFAIGGSATNLFFSLRYPSVAITPVIALVLVHPLGKLWDLIFKRSHDQEQDFVDGSLRKDGPQYASTTRQQRLRLWLAQGRWNEKEHACVYISSNVSFGFAFATDVIVEQHKFYKQEVPILYQLLLTISTQILGYAFAGLTRRYLVRPAAMIWPGTLMSTAMFTTMHKNENKVANGWTISRYRFFIYVWTAAFLWYFLPGLLMPALSYFNVITWFAPRNVVISNLVSLIRPILHPLLTRLVWCCLWPRSISNDF
jgi:hypothetical protein